MDDEAIRVLADRLRCARATVAFTGAGISTESGISDFRSPGGVWSRHRPVYFDEFLASHEARLRHWRMKRESWPEFRNAEPNASHRILAEWERAGRLMAVITQNIDGLHEKAGSRHILELHGTNLWVMCLDCRKRFPAGEVYDAWPDDDQVPMCDTCGGWLKPATVSFGQALPEDVLTEARRLSAESDVFLALGSSLVVEPAASLPALAKQRGAFLAIINRDATPTDDLADVVIGTPLGETLAAVANQM